MPYICTAPHSHGVVAYATIEAYCDGEYLGLLCEDHAASYFEDPSAAFRTL